MAASVRSGCTEASSSGPIEVDGSVFLRVRTCPLSGRKNTEPNVIESGPMGPTMSRWTIWNRGASQNPVTRFERVSVLTWEHGGFADRHPDLNEFASTLQSNKQLQGEFKVAYQEMVSVITEGRSASRAPRKIELP